MKRRLFSATDDATPTDCAQCGERMLFGIIRVVEIDGEKFRTCSQKCERELRDAKGVTVAHNDHLKEVALDKGRGTASGVHYKGIGVAGNGFILIAHNLPLLREWWAKISDAPLNEAECYPLAVFAQKDCT